MDLMPSLDQLSRLVGSVVHSVQPESINSGGQHRKVFALSSDQGDLVLRECSGKQGYYTHYFPYRVDPARWITQAWATQAAKDAGAPAPEIVAIDPVKRWVVMKRLPGIAIDHEYEHWQGCPYDEEQFGVILKRVHGIEPSGWGPIDDAGEGLFPSWPAFLVAAACSAIKTCLERRSIPEGLGHALERKWVSELKSLSISRPSLLHMESLGFANLMYDLATRTITGLWDYEDCMGGDPLFEIVWMRYYFEHEGVDQSYFDFACFARGYGQGYSMSGRALLYWPFTYLDKLRWLDPVGDRAQSYRVKLGAFV